MQKNDQVSTIPHSLSMINRSELTLSGVLEVVSATESLVNLKTSCGPLSISGSKLKIKNLNEDSKELSLDGEILDIKYNSGKKRFLEKCFK